ncbi:MAG: hypothetical protein CM15mP28_0960 [Pseudomonadota bacterium]|nr:MAG: hypothetical protein CM15mP28_0960 [Pseudomonadota bacterium]
MIHARKAFNIAWILVLLDHCIFLCNSKKEKGNKAVKVRLIIYAKSSTSEASTREASTTPYPREKGI